MEQQRDDGWETILPGDAVIDDQGAVGGIVAAVLPSFLAVSRGAHRPTHSYLPRSAVSRRERGRVFVRTNADQIHERWG